jgi:hypothetical protein
LVHEFNPTNQLLNRVSNSIQIVSVHCQSYQYKSFILILFTYMYIVYTIQRTFSFTKFNNPIVKLQSNINLYLFFNYYKNLSVELMLSVHSRALSLCCHLLQVCLHLHTHWFSFHMFFPRIHKFSNLFLCPLPLACLRLVSLICC